MSRRPVDPAPDTVAAVHAALASFEDYGRISPRETCLLAAIRHLAGAVAKLEDAERCRSEYAAEKASER